ncbi:MAG: T9SS type A sorting domain-containing protein [Cryomorphaceae bacterium]
MRPISITTILIFSIFYTLSTSAQSWMTDSLKWKETRELNFGLTETIAYTTYAQETINDTLYQSIYRVSCTNGLEENFVCHLRSEENQVFVRVEGQEYLLYDFDLEVGDIFTPLVCVQFDEVQILDGSQTSFEVADVSTTLIDGEERRVISFEPFSALQWIEGVGSNQGLFNGIAICAIDIISVLTCFERNTILEYTDPFVEICCPTTLSDDNDELTDHRTFAYPNPISLSQSLGFSESVESGQLTVFSQDGKLMYAEQISKTFNLTPSDMGLSPGLYHFQLEMENKRLHQKIVVY